MSPIAISPDMTEDQTSRFLNSMPEIRKTNGVHVNGKTSSKSIDMPMENVSAFTPRRKVKIVTVGAGFSALIFAHKLQHQHPEFQDLVEHQILEVRDDIGGTWLVNRYPGVQCDVPAHVYVCLHLCLIVESDF